MQPCLTLETLCWQTKFDHLTDTILPTQILNQGSKLVARSSDVSYSVEDSCLHCKLMEIS